MSYDFIFCLVTPSFTAPGLVILSRRIAALWILACRLALFMILPWRFTLYYNLDSCSTSVSLLGNKPVHLFFLIDRWNYFESFTRRAKRQLIYQLPFSRWSVHLSRRFYIEDFELLKTHLNMKNIQRHENALALTSRLRYTICILRTAAAVQTRQAAVWSRTILEGRSVHLTTLICLFVRWKFSVAIFPSCNEHWFEAI